MIDNELPAAVHSYRWQHDEAQVANPTWSWVAMQRIARNIHSTNPELLLARTDVTAFYENIETDILIEDLNNISAPVWAISTIRNFLVAFNGLGNAWGIPQSYEASGILANLYLLPVDQELGASGLQHLRYSDDVYIFGEDWVSLREQLLSINRLLRDRHLTLSNPKTKVVQGDAIVDEFEDADKDAINYFLLIGVPSAIKEVEDLFDRTIQESPIRTRDLKFCLTQLKYIGDDHAVDWLLKNLDEIPHVAREALSYLGRFQPLKPNIGKAIVSLLEDRGLTLYPYAQQHLLIYMISHRIVSQGAENVVWRLLTNRNVDSFVREFAARYVGLFATREKARRLRQLFQTETNTRVRRALLVACYESDQYTDSWLDIIATSDTSLYHTAKYLRTHPNSIPIPATGRQYTQIE
ncbi:RNA-directed DNA polymerase [Spirillospora sp. NPDC029432]|uniref:RNA-directed DNA polymerase n=1 Tax=Spirillospora sp. NPDC029432 TaxID=3154599 RepID=UPI00345684F4